MKKSIRYAVFSLLLAALAMLILPAGVIIAQDEVPEKAIRLELIEVPPFLRPISANPGQQIAFKLRISNTGALPVENIFLSAIELPADWAVTFRNDIGRLEAGVEIVVDVTVRTSAWTGSGDYTISFLASGDDVLPAREFVLIHITGMGAWLWVGLGVGLVVALGLLAVFLLHRNHG